MRIPLRFEFVHAAARHRVAESLVVALTVRSETDGRTATGYGQALPRAYVTGESLDACWESIHDHWWDALRELSAPLEEAPFLAARPLYERADHAGELAIYSALDTALFDAWGRLSGTSLARLWSKGKAPPPVIAPIPLNGPVAAWLAAYRLLGLRRLKIKVGAAEPGGLAADLQRVRRASRRGGGALGLDANGRLSPADALALVAALRRDAVAVDPFEEPLLPRSFAAMRELQNAGGVAVMADESLCGLSDARELIAQRAARVFNVRLAKVGGFSGLKAVTSLAAANGVRLRLGALVGESAVLAAAAAAATGLAEFETQEYGFGPLLLQRDPFRGGPRLRRGVVVANLAAAGLGVELCLKKLERLTVRSTHLEQP
jgi:muconate cycloisomerase